MIPNSIMPSPSEKLSSRRGPCMLCLRAIKWFPVVIIVSVIVWSYYAYVIQLCFMTVTSLFERLLYFTLYHCLLVLFIWAYWQTVFTKIGSVPQQFRIPPGDLEGMLLSDNDQAKIQIVNRFAQNLPISNRTAMGAVRFCEVCRHVKPDRAHHCSVCGECVLKMDHHCPWVNNCVSFTNYKFFILFLGYALLYCLFITLTTLQYFIQFWKGELEGMGRFHILLLFFLSVMFALSLVSLFGYHVYLVLQNRSTLESFRPPIFQSGPDKNGFSLGKYNNFQEVFGDNKKVWFLPIYSSLGDGVVFPVRAQHHSSLYNSMGSTQNSLGDGVTYPQRCVDEDTDTLLGGCQRWVDPEGAVYSDQAESPTSDPRVSVMQ